MDYLVDAYQSVGLAWIGLVESERRLKGKTTIEQRYYILSWHSCAIQFAEAVRFYWQVKNCLHLVLELGILEDECRIREDYAPANMALNLLSQDKKTAKGGIKAKRIKAGWNNAFLLKLLTQ